MGSFSIMDSLRVPEQEGDYVLQWRWDCEQTPQVWNSCADIIISSQSQPTPTPTPTSAPTPPTSGGCCSFGSSCGDCGTDGTGWCHLSASNCAACTGIFNSSASAPSCSGSPSPPPPSTSAPAPPRGCCKFGLNCGDCGTDGTGWCHLSASNCADCTGSFDSSASTPSCSESNSPSPSPSLRAARRHQ